MALIPIRLNGKSVKAAAGSTVLEVARLHGVPIPTLCNHEALKPYGACRLCIVEIEESGQKRIATSCTTPVSRGMIIATRSPRVLNVLKTLVGLLRSRCPDAPVVQQLARDVGAESIPAAAQKSECILCGLCVRVCHEIVGAHALSFVYKGSRREPAAAFFRDSQECIGCGSCVFVCPTGYVKMHDVSARPAQSPERVMDTWKTHLAVQTCAVDNRPYATKRFLEQLAQRHHALEEGSRICPECRRDHKAP